MKYIKNNSKDYSRKYFTEQFRVVGDFDKRALKRNKYWFLGQLSFFEKFFLISFKKAKRILEVGCAIGGIASLFEERNVETYAVDISSYAIQKAKNLSPKINFYSCDIQNNIPIKKKFDFIFAFEVLEHLKDPVKGLKNIKTKLSDGGMLIATTPYPFKKYVDINTHVNVLFPSDWERLMKEAGFKKVLFQPVTFIPFLYRLSSYLSIILPFNSNLPFVNSTVFYVAK